MIDATSKEEALQYLLIGLMITILSFGLELWSRNLATIIECESIKLIRENVMKKILRKKIHLHLKGENSDILSTLTNDMRIIYDDYFTAIYTITLYGGMLFFAMCMYIFIDPMLLLFVMLASTIPLILPRILEKICAYSVLQDNTESFGMLYYADIIEFGELPDLEMEKIECFIELPTRWTYPDIQPRLLAKVEEFRSLAYH